MSMRECQLGDVGVDCRMNPAEIRQWPSPRPNGRLHPLAPEVVYPHTARVVSEDDRCDTCGQRAVIGMCASCEAEQAAINSGGWW